MDRKVIGDALAELLVWASCAGMVAAGYLAFGWPAAIAIGSIWLLFFAYVLSRDA